MIHCAPSFPLATIPSVSRILRHPSQTVPFVRIESCLLRLEEAYRQGHILYGAGDPFDDKHISMMLGDFAVVDVVP